MRRSGIVADDKRCWMNVGLGHPSENRLSRSRLIRAFFEGRKTLALNRENALSRHSFLSSTPIGEHAVTVRRFRLHGQLMKCSRQLAVELMPAPMGNEFSNQFDPR